MGWHEELRTILERLNITMHDDTAEQPAHDISLFQQSREHQGVFYRLDLVADAPELRVFVPRNDGAARLRCFVVRVPTESPLRAGFTALMAWDTSPLALSLQLMARQHLLFAIGEVLKQLFWAGDTDAGYFPPEIAVTAVDV
jgi:hypothetical protein